MGMDMTSGLTHKSHAKASNNFDLLVDIEVRLSLILFIPLVNAAHALINLSQTWDIFMCDLMQTIKLCQNELARFFIDSASANNKEDFPT